MKKIIEIESLEPIPEYAGLANITSITVKDGCEWDGHAYGDCIGMIDDEGNIDSYFKKDKENNNTVIFDSLRNDIQLIEKHCNFRKYNSMEVLGGTKYYIPYKVKEHCSSKPTVTETHVDNCSNVHYSMEYEILLIAGEGFRRYITMEFETEGRFASSFYDQIESFEDMFEEWFEEESHGFGTYEEGGKYISFYNDIGERCEIDICSVREALNMITSIRVIKCDIEIIK